MLAVNFLEDVCCLTMTRTLLRYNLRVSCSFLVDGLCVDTGPPTLKGPFAAYLQKARPEQAFCTHAHEDHAGNVDVLNRLGLIPLIHRMSLPLVENPPRIPLYRHLVWGPPTRGRGRGVEVKGDEERLLKTKKYSFQILPSPGHCKDHLCLYEKEMGWLFSGDAYLGERVLYLHAGEDMGDLLITLEYLSSLDFQVIFCGHRGIVKKGPESFRAKLDYLKNLQGEARELARKGWSERAITRRLLGREDIMRFFSGGEFSKILLIRGLLEEKKEKKV